MKTIIANGKPVSDDASRVCVLFDPKNGRVVHVHGVTTLPGGKKVGESEMAERTLARAKSLGHQVSGLKSLHLPVSAIRGRGPFKVNAKGTELEFSKQAPMSAAELFAKLRKPKSKKSK
ncbi:MAG TPA: hypothetical protein VJR23_10370 [Candidatus Acidoferrales bacterium]|nr:hypothetical protein [Candidatus Acidoferrales bacterium]